MITDAQSAFLKRSLLNAEAAGHIFPPAAAAEAALESTWGTSKLALQANNLFGMKVPEHGTPFSEISIPTREFLHGQWVTVEADWVVFPTIADCFRDRMATLVRESPIYPNYVSALAAQTPELYLFYVSKTWSTDPQRGNKCISILHSHRDILYPKEETPSEPTQD